MKKSKKIGIIAIVLIAISSVVFIACNRSDDLISVSNDLTSVEKSQVESIFALRTGDIVPDANYTNEFSSFSDAQMDYYFTLLSDEFSNIFVDGLKLDDVKLTQDEVKIYYKVYFLSINEVMLDLLGKKYNQLSKSEVHTFIGDFMYEILEKMKSDRLPKNIEKFVQNFQDDLVESDFSKTTRSISSSCPQHYYGISTGVSSSGSKVCKAYTSATNIGDDDCDYEFTFDWLYPSTPSILYLNATHSGVSAILSAEGVNGRYDSFNSTVSVLMGKWRVNTFGLGPSNVKNNLYGNWWLT